MSRLLLLLTLVLVPAASAQSVLSDSTTFYVIPHVGAVYSLGDGQAGLLGAVVGRRVSSRVDLGLRLDAGDAATDGRALFVAVGPQVGVTGGAGRLETALRAGTTVLIGQRVAPTDARGVQSVGARAEWTVSRAFTSGGLRLAPVLGAYGAVCATRNAAPTGAGCAEAGAISGFEVGFRALGADVSVPLTVRRRVAGDQRAASSSGLGLMEGTVSSGVRVRF